MKGIRYANDVSHLFFSELTAEIIAKSGIPSDKYHMGKILMHCLKANPDWVCQIDGYTGEQETNASVLKRSIRCAVALRRYGLKCGDVIALMAPNFLDLAIPYYAGLYLGVASGVIERYLNSNELQNTFDVERPKVVFCDSTAVSRVQEALKALNLNAKLVTFDKVEDICGFNEFLDKYSDVNDEEQFRAEDFDPEDTCAVLLTTSGTTGLPKAAGISHKNFAITGPYFWATFYNFPTPTKMSIVPAPMQWLTAVISFTLTPIFQIVRLQTSAPEVTVEHLYHLINTYRPTFIIGSSTFLTKLVMSDTRDMCDFTCFDQILIGGTAVPDNLIREIKKISPKTDALNAYGMTELSSFGLQAYAQTPGSCGRPLGCLEYRLIDLETQEDITQPHVTGELWARGPGVIKGYYKNPEATAETFTVDGWLKTGDSFYRDEYFNFYFVERIKLMMKYNSHHISPGEIENVIRQHPGVLDVAVIGVPDPTCGELPVACVVRRQGHTVTAQEVKDMVKDNLSDPKHLRGGVIFLNEIPMTVSTKVHRRKLKEIVASTPRE